MIIKFTSTLLILMGIISCSPVKFNTKSTSSNPCQDGSCQPLDDGTSLWRADGWGICSQSCGTGNQSRNVTCVNKSNVVVPDTYCKEAKPAITQNCNVQACTGTPTWNSGPWATCSSTCGGGTQSRVVECRDNSGVLIDSSCTAAKPANQQACNTQACTCNAVDKTLTQTIPANGNKVDILIVVDDSTTMTQDNLKVAERLNGFVTDLQNNNLDWQMCITTTDVGYYEGRPIKWSGVGTRLVTKATPNLSTVFQQTITDIGSGFSNDEQGIKASILSMLNNAQYPCYRTGAASAVIIVSDEDERSVGGNQSLSTQQYQALGFNNLPSTFVATANAVFGAGRRLAVNSIIVPDNQCKQIQDQQGYPGFIGTKYIELSNLTGSPIGNICDTDYSTNLKYFKDSVLATVSSVDLECAPTGTPVVTLPTGYTWTIQGQKVTFTPALSAGVNLSISYKCCP